MIDDSETLVFFSSICIYFGLNKKYFCVIVLKLHFETCIVPESYESFSMILIIRNSHTNISSNIGTIMVFCTGLVLPHCSDNNDLLFLLLLLYLLAFSVYSPKGGPTSYLIRKFTTIFVFQQ